MVPLTPLTDHNRPERSATPITIGHLGPDLDRQGVDLAIRRPDLL